MTQINGVGSSASTATLTTVGGNRHDSVKPHGVLPRVDQATLSVAGGLVAQAGSDVRLDKVQALQQTIAAGTYRVSASDVASKIVDSLLT